jgi:16S rRNA (cytosine967-C5)-methyltransferase
MLDPKPGERVIDACAGAGGKSLHLAALMKNKGKILSLDIHERKLEELRKRASRAGADIIETRTIDSSKVIKRLEETADRLLLDVPCSGLGVLRRNPDSKWKLSDEEIEKLRALQSQILESYSKMVKPGGRMVYATCSILPSENERQVEEFLKNAGGTFELLEERKFAPGKDGFDGFYAASLQKN